MENKLPLLIKRLTQAARLPTKGSPLAAGYDLYSSEENVVPARGKACIKTGISIAVPHGNYGRVGNITKSFLCAKLYIAPRSGLAAKNFIDVGAGVIDEDYRGEGKLYHRLGYRNKHVYLDHSTELNHVHPIYIIERCQFASLLQLMNCLYFLHIINFLLTYIVGVILFNHAETDFKVAIGDRIAQLIIEKITDTNIVEVDSLDETVRGAGGFGSTGVSTAVDPKKADGGKTSGC